MMTRHSRSSVDGMKRLVSRLTWWPTRPHKSTPAVTASVRKARRPARPRASRCRPAPPRQGSAAESRPSVPAACLLRRLDEYSRNPPVRDRKGGAYGCPNGDLQTRPELLPTIGATDRRGERSGGGRDVAQRGARQ